MKVVSVHGPRFVVVRYSFILDGRKFNSDTYWDLLVGTVP